MGANEGESYNVSVLWLSANRDVWPRPAPDTSAKISKDTPTHENVKFG